MPHRQEDLPKGRDVHVARGGGGVAWVLSLYYMRLCRKGSGQHCQQHRDSANSTPPSELHTERHVQDLLQNSECRRPASSGDAATFSTCFLSLFKSRFQGVTGWCRPETPPPPPPQPPSIPFRFCPEGAPLPGVQKVVHRAGNSNCGSASGGTCRCWLVLVPAGMATCLATLPTGS
jgi:hypothetical protein